MCRSPRPDDLKRVNLGSRPTSLLLVPPREMGTPGSLPVPEDLESKEKGSETETKLSWPVLLAHRRERPHKWSLEEMAPFLVSSKCGNTSHTLTGFPKPIWYTQGASGQEAPKPLTDSERPLHLFLAWKRKGPWWNLLCFHHSGDQQCLAHSRFSVHIHTMEWMTCPGQTGDVLLSQRSLCWWPWTWFAELNVQPHTQEMGRQAVRSKGRIFPHPSWWSAYTLKRKD